MNDECEAMEIESDLPEFTFSEIMHMEKLLKVMKDKPVDEMICREISAKFNISMYRYGKPPIQWAQVQSWFRDKQMLVGPKVASPSKEAVVSPPKKAVFSPPKRATVSPPKEAVVSPPKEVVSSPPKKAVVSPLEEAVVSPPKGAVVSKTAVLKKREKVATISASEAAVELSNLIFEARSAKDSAWFDVGSFLTYRINYSGELLEMIEMLKFMAVATISASEAAVELSNLIFEARSAKDSAWFDVGSFLTYRINYSGELVVRVRFAGFGKEEDEWVSVKRALRERSLPLEPSECDKIDVGDLVLCFRENEDHALYCDAHVVEIERKIHDSDCCTCVFTVRFEHDNVEGKVTLAKLCCRPKKSECNDSKIAPLEPTGMQKGIPLVKDVILVE